MTPYCREGLNLSKSLRSWYKRPIKERIIRNIKASNKATRGMVETWSDIHHQKVAEDERRNRIAKLKEAYVRVYGKEATGVR